MQQSEQTLHINFKKCKHSYITCSNQHSTIKHRGTQIIKVLKTKAVIAVNQL